MYDIFHQWGGDLVVGSGGDLAISTGADTVNQRVYRRLLTNSGDYIWNLDYGGGLSQFIGQPSNTTNIEAIVRTQLAQEAAVPATPAPRVTVGVVDTAGGYVVASISYADPLSLTPVLLNVAAG